MEGEERNERVGKIEGKIEGEERERKRERGTDGKKGG